MLSLCYHVGAPPSHILVYLTDFQPKNVIFNLLSQIKRPFDLFGYLTVSKFSTKGSNIFSFFLMWMTIFPHQIMSTSANNNNNFVSLSKAKKNWWQKKKMFTIHCYYSHQSLFTWISFTFYLWSDIKNKNPFHVSNTTNIH